MHDDKYEVLTDNKQFASFNHRVSFKTVDYVLVWANGLLIKFLKYRKIFVLKLSRQFSKVNLISSWIYSPLIVEITIHRIGERGCFTFIMPLGRPLLHTSIWDLFSWTFTRKWYIFFCLVFRTLIDVMTGTNFTLLTGQRVHIYGIPNNDFTIDLIGQHKDVLFHFNPRFSHSLTTSRVRFIENEFFKDKSFWDYTQCLPQW